MVVGGTIAVEVVTVVLLYGVFLICMKIRFRETEYQHKIPAIVNPSIQKYRVSAFYNPL